MSTFNRLMILGYHPGDPISCIFEGDVTHMQEIKWEDKNTVVPVTENDEPDGWVYAIEPYTVDGGKAFGSILPCDPIKFVRKRTEFGVAFVMC